MVTLQRPRGHPTILSKKLVTPMGLPIATCREPLLHLPSSQSGERPLDDHPLTIQALCPLELMVYTSAPGKFPST